MIPLSVRHRTAYRYRQPVELWPHRLMLCPRESRDLQVISCVVTVSPTAEVTWAHDVFGNAVATAAFRGPSDNLIIDSVVELRLEAAAWPIFHIAASAIVYPFRYSDDEWTDLGALTDAAISGSVRTPRDLGPGLRPGESDRYPCAAQRPRRRRFRGGPLPEPGRRGRPVADRNARPWMGLLPRFRGPLRRSGASSGLWRKAGLRLPFQPGSDASGIDGGRIDPRLGEVFVSGAGWISFDPTNRSVGGANSIPVAVARDIRQAAPVSGAYVGSSDALESMSVEVAVTPSAAPSCVEG